MLNDIEKIVKQEIGSEGKTILDDVFREHGIDVEDLDDISRLEDILYEELRERFGIEKAETVADRMKKKRLSEELRQIRRDKKSEVRARRRFEILKELGELSLNLNELKEAEDHFDDLYALSESSGRDEMLAVALESLAELYIMENDTGKLEERAKEMIRLSKKIGDETVRAKGIRFAGLAAWRKSNLEEGLNYLKSSLDMFYEEEQMEEVAKVLRDIGDLHVMNGDLEQGIKCYREAAEEFGKVGMYYERVNLLMEIGMILSDTDEVEEAVKIFERAQSESEEHSFYDYRGWCLFNLGELYMEEGRWEAADNSLKEAISIFEGQKDADGEAGAKMAYGLSLIERGKLQEGEKMLKRALKIFRGADSPEPQVKTLFHLSKVQKQIGGCLKSKNR